MPVATIDRSISSHTYSRQQLERDYDLDDERLEIVCCWHQLYDCVDSARFDRYPALEHPDGSEDKITPDFVVDFDGQDYRLIGEICRLPADDRGFRDQMAQPKLYARSGSNVDVLFLTHHSFAEKNEKRALDEGLLGQSEEQVIFISYVRDGLGGNSWWLFKRASRFRDVEFRDAFVGQWSLYRRFTETLDGVHVPSKRWGAYKAQFPTCNDAPSAIYMACLLWDRVFPTMVSQDQYEDAAAQGSPPVFDIAAEELVIRDRARTVLNSERIKVTWIRRALELLQDARRAEKSGSAWRVKWGQLKAPREDIRDTHLKLIHRLAPADFDNDENVDPAQTSLFPEVAVQTLTSTDSDPND